MPSVRAEVWLADGRSISDERIAGYCDWLNVEEQKRLARFVRFERKRQFVLGRVLLRECLGSALQVPARTVRLLEQPGNAPRLVFPDIETAGLSISHSGDWVACAVSATTALGLDIERVDASRNIEELAAQAFDPEQRAWLAARPDSSRLRDFYQLWSQQEARFKLPAPVAYETALYHPELAAVLCSAQPLTDAPQFQNAILAP
jgi:4'-phosphopantetheinyl transferase